MKLYIAKTLRSSNFYQNSIVIASSKEEAKIELLSMFTGVASIETLDKNPDLLMFHDGYGDNVSSATVVRPRDEETFVRLYGSNHLPK